MCASRLKNSYRRVNVTLRKKKRWEGRIERLKLVSLAGRFYHLQSEMQSTLTLLTVKPVHAFTSLTD